MNGTVAASHFASATLRHCIHFRSVKVVSNGTAQLYEYLCDFLYRHQFLCDWHMQCVANFDSREDSRVPIQIIVQEKALQGARALECTFLPKQCLHLAVSSGSYEL